MNAAAASDTMTVANRLIELCREMKHHDAIDELYHPDVVSVEAAVGPDCDVGREMRGIDTIKQKNESWFGANEVHERTIEGPFPHGDDRFALVIGFTITPKDGPMQGQRMSFREVGVYTVLDTKIAREEYFYAMPEGE